VQLDLLAGKPWFDSAARLLFETLTAVQFPLKMHITLELRFRLKPRPVDRRCQRSLWGWVLSDFSFAYTCSHLPSWYKYNRRSVLPSTVLPALTSPSRATFLGLYGDSVVSVFCSFHGIYGTRLSRFNCFWPVTSSCWRTARYCKRLCSSEIPTMNNRRQISSIDVGSLVFPEYQLK
jgi:hypothetical protein